MAKVRQIGNQAVNGKTTHTPVQILPVYPIVIPDRDEKGNKITKGANYFPDEPNKIVEFRMFLDLYKIDPEKPEIDSLIFIATLNNTKIARMLGVSPDTITDWRKTPQFIAMRQACFKEVLKKMSKAGEDDWKMWRDVLKFAFGIEDVNTLKHEAGDSMKNQLSKEEQDAIKRIKFKKTQRLQQRQ